MFTLNIYNRNTKTYLFSITKNKRNECLAIAEQKYADMNWEWDDKNYVKNKKYNSDPKTAVCLSLSNLI